jgi:Sec7-like guanine-nucleotide exchange factor
MNTTWNIIKLICKNTDNNLSDVVYRVQWECKKSDSVNNFVKEGGMCILPQPDPNNFTQYNSLTKAEVVSWVQSVLGTTFISELEARLTERLDEKVNTVILDPPFNN